jgi:hypothetical protein
MAYLLYTLTPLALVIALYRLVAEPWMATWGATEKEQAMPLPGDELVPEPQSTVTHAITIDAPSSAVWPWLLQLGQERGGFYSYQRLENLIGCEIHNLYEIDPDLQITEIGERVSLGATDNYPHYIVNAIEPGRSLVLLGEDSDLRTTWQYVLEPAGADRTRLLIRSRFERSPGFGPWLVYGVLMPPAHFIMERKMMRTIKRLAESTGVAVPA